MQYVNRHSTSERSSTSTECVHCTRKAAVNYCKRSLHIFTFTFKVNLELFHFFIPFDVCVSFVLSSIGLQRSLGTADIHRALRRHYRCHRTNTCNGRLIVNCINLPDLLS